MRFWIIIMTTGLFVSGQLPAQTLRAYQQMAAADNPGLRAKYKDFEASLQRVAQAKSLPDPNLAFGYFIAPVQTRVGPQRARISLSQMFPWFGTLKARKEASALLAEAHYQSFLDAENQLYYQVAVAYYHICEQRKLDEIEVEHVRLLESYKSMANKRFEQGGRMVDVLHADILLQESKTALEVLRKQDKSLQTRFNKLLNLSDNQDVVVDDSVLVTARWRVEDRDALLTQNPRLNALDLKAQSSEYQRIVSVKRGLPNLGVGLDYVMIDKRSDALVADNGKDALMPMLTVSLPIFRSQHKAAQKEAALMQESYVLQKKDLRNVLISKYEKELYILEKQQDMISLYERQLEVLQQSLALLFSEYSHSGEGFEEVLRVQQKILNYKRLRVNAFKALHIAHSELEYLTAGSSINYRMK